MIMRRLLATTLLAVFITPVLPMPRASAQAELQVELIEFPSWLDREGTIRIGLRVANRGDEVATGLRVSMSIHDGIDTRSQLERAFDESLGPVVGSDTFALAEEIQPRSAKDIYVEKPLQEISFFRTGPDDRAYPVRITLRNGDVASEPIDTFMIFASTPAIEPLRLALIVPIHHPVVYSPSLEINENVDELIEAIETGRISRLLNALDAYPDVPITLAPTGLFLDMLHDLADGYTREGESEPVDPTDPAAVAAGLAIQRMRTAVARPFTRIVSAPYSLSALPVLGERLADFRASAQIGATRNLIQQVIGEPPLTGWVLPLPGVLDEPSMSILQSSGPTTVILQPESLQLGRTSLTRAAPAEASTRFGSSGILITDDGLSSRLDTRGLDAIRARQQFLAETFTIYLERPAQPRIVAAVAPTVWRMPAGAISGILAAMASSSWLRGIGPDQAIPELGHAPSVRLESGDALLDEDQIPPSEYFESLEAAGRSIDKFSEISPPQELLMALDKRMLIAESSEWWTSRKNLSLGRNFANAVNTTVEEEFSKLRAPSPLTITLTSRNGVIPLSITSNADYPVDVVIRLESTQLQFPGTERCAGSSTGRCIEIKRLPPLSQTVEVQTIAEGTGTFPVRVVLQTPSSSTELDSTRLSVRSTAYNVVGTGITIGAGLFLIAWPIASFFRKRRMHERAS